MDLEIYYSTVMPAVSVVVLLVFIGIVAWAYWPTHRARFERDGHIPLRDDE